MTEDPTGRRQRLLLDLLRLSRDPWKRAELEAALVSIDDGGRPWVSPEDERSLLRRAGERLGSTFEKGAFENWRKTRRKDIQASVAACNDARLGRVASPELSPEL